MAIALVAGLLSLALCNAFASSAAASDPSIAKLVIDPKPKKLERLQRDRAVLRAGETPSGSFVKTRLHFAGSERKARVRARETDSARPDAWSLELRLKGDNVLLGMRRLILLTPPEAGQAAALFDHLRREAVLAPRTARVRVWLADEELGLAVVHEELAKELLESQARREGPLLRFEPSGHAGEGDPSIAHLLRGLRAVDRTRSEKLWSDTRTASALLRGYLQGELPAAAVFDVGVTGRFLAIAELWGAESLLDWRNVGFYFNPVTQRIEPIAAPGVRVHDPDGARLIHTRVGALLLENRSIREATARELQRIARDLLREPGELPALRTRAGELATLEADDLRPFAAPIASSDSQLYPLRAYRSRDQRGSYIELANLGPSAVTLTGLFEDDGALEGRTLESLAQQEWPVALAASTEPPERARVRLAAVPEGDHLFATLTIAGEPRRQRVELVPRLPVPSANPIPTATLADALEHHPYLSFDAQAGALRARPGEWRIDEPLILPDGVGLSLPPGTTLRFARDAMLVGSGPLRFRGTKDAPIVLEGMPDPKGPGRWPGIAILSSAEPHDWRWVRVSGTTGIDHEGWQLTGGVTLRRAQVRMADSEFSGNHCEDALNLVRSRFELRDVVVTDAPSDAFDGDFSDGLVENGAFRQIGGDAIDVSGADVQVKGTVLEDVHDKAISVGEGSRLTASAVRIRRVGTAVASKDGSHTLIRDSEISQVRHTALMAYVKKAEYGPASLTASGLRMREFGRKAVVQVGSELRIDGEDQPAEDVDIDALYKHGYMKK